MKKQILDFIKRKTIIDIGDILSHFNIFHQSYMLKNIDDLEKDEEIVIDEMKRVSLKIPTEPSPQELALVSLILLYSVHKNKESSVEPSVQEQLKCLNEISVKQSEIFTEIFKTIKNLPSIKLIKLKDIDYEESCKEIKIFKTMTLQLHGDIIDNIILDEIKNLLGASKYTISRDWRNVIFHLDFLK